MLGVNVAGGTDAGRKLKREPRRVPWQCRRGHVNPRYATRCLGERCHEKRPTT